jgi:hypothetical protein
MPITDSLREVLDRCAVPDVTDLGLASDLAGHPFEALAAATNEHQPVGPQGELAGKRRPDPARASCDYGNHAWVRRIGLAAKCVGRRRPCDAQS